MSPSWYSNIVRTDDDVKRMGQFMREKGYDRGYAGLPAQMTNREYQQGWKRGREARKRDGLDA